MNRNEFLSVPSCPFESLLRFFAENDDLSSRSWLDDKPALSTTAPLTTELPIVLQFLILDEKDFIYLNFVADFSLQFRNRRHSFAR